jgi:heme oxygenase
MSGDYIGLLPSGAQVAGTKQAIQEMHAHIWRAEPTTGCTGQTWRDFAERCDRARMEAEKKVLAARAEIGLDEK